MIGVSLPRFAGGLRLPVASVRRGDVGLDPEDRPDALLDRLVVEAERPEHVAVIRDGHRGHTELRDELAELRQTVRAVEKRILTVKMKVDELAGHPSRL